MKTQSILTILISAILAGCGGGSDGNDPSPTLPNEPAVPSEPSEPAEPVENLSPIQIGMVYIQNGFGDEFYEVNLTTGELGLQSPVKCSFSLAAVDSEGYVVGASYGGHIFDIDPVSGECVYRFSGPEQLSAMAIAPNGDIIGTSFESTFNIYKIYTLGQKGDIINQAAIPRRVTGLDYGPDGNLYANMFGMLKLDPSTGIGTVANWNSDISLAIADICIAGDGAAYAHSLGILYKYNSTTGELLNRLTLEKKLGLGTIICR